MIERVIVSPGARRGAPVIELRGSIQAIFERAGGTTFKSAAVR